MIYIMGGMHRRPQICLLRSFFTAMARWARLARRSGLAALPPRLAAQRVDERRCRCELQSLPVQRHVSRADHDKNKVAEHLAAPGSVRARHESMRSRMWALSFCGCFASKWIKMSEL